MNGAGFCTLILYFGILLARYIPVQHQFNMNAQQFHAIIYQTAVMARREIRRLEARTRDIAAENAFIIQWSRLVALPTQELIDHAVARREGTAQINARMNDATQQFFENKNIFNQLWNRTAGFVNNTIRFIRNLPTCLRTNLTNIITACWILTITIKSFLFAGRFIFNIRNAQNVRRFLDLLWIVVTITPTETHIPQDTFRAFLEILRNLDIDFLEAARKGAAKILKKGMTKNKTKNQ